MRDERDPTQGTWRDVLRAGDPYSEAEALTPDEVQQMRQRVVASSATQPGKKHVRIWVPAIASAAAIVIMTLVGALVFRKAPGTGPTTIARVTRPPVEGVVAAESSGARPALAPPELAGGRSQTARDSMRSRSGEAARRTATPVAPSARAVADPPRQLHFTTPGGTQIVWVLRR